MKGMLIMDRYLYDFRTSIVEKKRCKEYWKDWNDWNILYKTLAYELSSSRDVERYECVRNQVFEYYEDYKQYVGDESSLDIMNGWWFCFKVLFNIKTSRGNKQTKDFIRTLMKNIEGKNRKEILDLIKEEYKVDIEVMKAFLDFLEIVYTIGNITPVPKGGNIHADKFDCWEYKLFISKAVKYKKENYKKYFYFEEYKEDDKWWEELKYTDDKTQVVFNYMKSRIQLIDSRGKIIVNRNKRCN